MNYKAPRHRVCILIAFIFLTFNSCKKIEQHENSRVNGVEKSIIKKCLAKLNEPYAKHQVKLPYLVYPIFSEFDFATFSRQSKALVHYQRPYNIYKSKVLKSNNWSEEKFNTVKTQVDRYYLEKRDNSLIDFSNAETSNIIYFFSGVHENLVFVDRIDFCKCYTKQELLSSAFSKNGNFMSFTSLVFILKNGEVVEEIWYDGRTFEGTCSQGEYSDCY